MSDHKAVPPCVTSENADFPHAPTGGKTPVRSASADVLEPCATTALFDSISMGVDIVEIERIRAILKRSPAFARRAFSADEQAYCNAATTPEYHYATRFAAKEAVVKALGTGFSSGITPRDIEVVLNVKGKPHVRLRGRAAEVARQAHITELPLSLSYTHTEAVACALALRAEDAAESKQVDPTEELTRQFKEVRSLLDDLPTHNPREGE